VVIIDSSVLIDVLAKRLNAHTSWLIQRRYVEHFAITSLILCEVLQGLRWDDQVAPARRLLAQFEMFETGGEDLALESALNYRVLRRKGITVRKTIDCLIATFCIRQGHTLLHHDRDFDAFEDHLGLQVIHPLDRSLQ
jgi:predicted nucleic acid-binding protein